MNLLALQDSHLPLYGGEELLLVGPRLSQLASLVAADEDSTRCANELSATPCRWRLDSWEGPSRDASHAAVLLR